MAHSAAAQPTRLRRLRGRYQRNRIMVWMCVTIFVNQLGFGSIVPVVPLYADTFGVSLTAIGLAVAIYGVARFLFNVPTARVADRWGRREALAIGGAITAVGSLISALAPDYWIFLFGRFLSGGGASMVITGGQIVMSDITVPANRGRTMALYQGVVLLAFGIGPIPGGLLAEHVSLSAPFWGHAVLTLIVAALALWRVPETRGLSAGRSTATAAPQLAFLSQVRVLLGETGFLLIGIVAFASFFTRTGGLFSLIPNLADERLGLTPSQIGLGMAFISLLGFGLAYPSGWLVDRFGRKVVIVPSTIGTGIAMVIFALMTSYSWFVVACFVWAAANGIASSAPNSYAADMAPAGMNASAMGTFRMIADSGYVAGPFLLGMSADLMNTTTALYLTAALVIGAGLLFALLAPETYSARSAGRGS